MILEVAVLKTKPNQNREYESAFLEVSGIIASMPGYVSHNLHKCIEVENQYLLLVNWETLEAHIGFRQSQEYQTWKETLHHFYDPFPVVEHYQTVTKNVQ